MCRTGCCRGCFARAFFANGPPLASRILVSDRPSFPRPSYVGFRTPLCARRDGAEARADRRGCLHRGGRGMSRASREGSRQAWRQDRQGACPREAEAHQRTVCPDALYTSDAPTRPRRSARPGERSRSRLDARAEPAPSLSKRVTRLDSQGEFKEWLKATQKGPRRTWHDRGTTGALSPISRLPPSRRTRSSPSRSRGDTRGGAGRAARCVARVAEGPAPGRGADERPLVARRAASATPAFPSRTPLFRVTCPGGLGVPSRDRRGGARATA